MTVLIGLGVGLMSFLVASMFPALEDTLAELDLGPAFDGLVGAGGFSTPQGWLGGEMYSILIPASIISLVVVDAGRSIAGEEEDLSLGLLASNPISRSKILFDKSIAVVVHIVVATAILSLLTWSGVVVVGLDMDASYVWAAMVHVVAFGFMMTGAAVFFCVLLGKRVITMITVGGLAFVAYMVSALLPISADLAGWAKLSPWYYYWAENPLLSGVNWADVGVMAAIGIVLFGFAFVRFARKDLRG